MRRRQNSGNIAIEIAVERQGKIGPLCKLDGVMEVIPSVIPRRRPIWTCRLYV
jgi:hypothetical protein